MIAYNQVQSCLDIDLGIFAITAPMTGLEADRQLVNDLVEWSGKSVAAIASAAGMANTTLNRHSNGTATTRLSQPTIDKLRTAFPDFPQFAIREGLAANAKPFKMEGASSERMRENLPIYGTAMGASRQIDGEAIEQTTLNRAEVAEYAKRPVILNGKVDAYGLYVSGSSMEPRHMDGETILVDPKGRLRSGEDVVVYLRPTSEEEDDGEAARAVLVKRLVRRSSTFIELQQFTPPLTFRVDVADVVRIDRVIPWSELLS